MREKERERERERENYDRGSEEIYRERYASKKREKGPSARSPGTVLLRS